MEQNLRRMIRRLRESCIRGVILYWCLSVLLICLFILFGNRQQTSINRETPNKENSLAEIYENYDGPYGFDHWKEYASHYDFHLKQVLHDLPTTKTFRMLEIGVQSGGSVEIWASYFSTKPFYYVGMDIDERCKRSEDVKRNIFIEIGSQESPEFLLRICQKHGPFDFIIDDGGHTSEMMKVSLDTLFLSDSCMTKNSLYAIEDMHSMVGVKFSNRALDIPWIPAEMFRRMHYYWYKRANLWKLWKNSSSLDKEWTDRIKSISLYDSMMFVRRHGTESGPMTRILKGNDWIPYQKNDQENLKNGIKQLSPEQATVSESLKDEESTSTTIDEVSPQFLSFFHQINSLNFISFELITLNA
jgi:hypothetical protein